MYTWSLPPGWIQTAGGNTNSIVVRAGASSGIISVTPSSLACGNGPSRSLYVSPTTTVTDIDGNPYPAILVGQQCWMKENIRTTRNADGSALTRYCYGNIIANCTQYGGIYTWSAIMNGAGSSNSSPSGVQGLCPYGWHIPSKAEFEEMITFLGGTTVAGGKMKTIGTALWSSPNTAADNSSNFSALPSGYRQNNGNFTNLGAYGYWWSATQNNVSTTWTYSTGYNYADAPIGFDDKLYGFSVRCVKD